MLSRPDRTREICRGVTRHLAQRGYATVAEMTFANGRRADVFAMGPDGEIVVVEVKSGWEDFRVDQKWPDYRDYCDRFYFAVDVDFPQDVVPADVGLIVADGYGGEMLREAPSHPLAAARRRALMIAFAQLSSRRLLTAIDPEALRDIVE
ncbi:MmcB family DNA repair protein [Terrarubrum flagellatum]|uniref:MmcB family DNA repair protein n=1 Tax=Terrirubrum flagellatum TaxID=2895980 RepID=UPI0031453C94